MSRMTKRVSGTKRSRGRKIFSRPLIRGKCFFQKSSGMSKTSKMFLKYFFRKKVTWLDFSRSRSRDLKVIAIDSYSLPQDASLCKIWCKSNNPSSSYSNGSQRDRQTDRVTYRQLHSGHHNTVKTSFSKTSFCGKNVPPLILHAWLKCWLIPHVLAIVIHVHSQFDRIAHGRRFVDYSLPLNLLPDNTDFGRGANE